MQRKRSAIRALGLSALMALGLLAISATAQAGEFRLGGHTFTADGTAEASATGTISLSQLSVSWAAFEIRCGSGAFSAGLLLGGTIHAAAQFNECEIPGNKNCLIFASKADLEKDVNQSHIAAQGLGAAILHGGKHYIKFEGQFTTLYIGNHLGKKLCTLPQEMTVTGSFAIEGPSALTEQLSQPYKSISKANQELLGVKIFCAGNSAEILGSEGTISLTSDTNWGFE